MGRSASLNPKAHGSASLRQGTRGTQSPGPLGGQLLAPLALVPAPVCSACLLLGCRRLHLQLSKRGTPLLTLRSRCWSKCEARMRRPRWAGPCGVQQATARRGQLPAAASRSLFSNSLARHAVRRLRTHAVPLRVVQCSAAQGPTAWPARLLTAPTRCRACCTVQAKEELDKVFSELAEAASAAAARCSSSYKVPPRTMAAYLFCTTPLATWEGAGTACQPALLVP